MIVQEKNWVVPFRARRGQKNEGEWQFEIVFTTTISSGNRPLHEISPFSLSFPKLHYPHSEAYLVYVDATWRGQGYGSCLVQRLTQEATLPIYLASQPHRMQFYTRLGFVPVPTNAVPANVRANLGLDRYEHYNMQALVFKPA